MIIGSLLDRAALAVPAEGRGWQAFAPGNYWDLANPSAIPPPGWAGASYAGVAVNEYRVAQISAVYSCVGLIADSLSMLPESAFRQRDRFREPVVPTPQIVANPHPEFGRIDWDVQLMWSLLLRGNAFAPVVERDRLGYPTTLMPVHPDDVSVLRNRITRRIEYKLASGEVLNAERYGQPGGMLHIRGITPPGAIEGVSVVEYHRQAFGLALAAEEFGSRYFGDGANPSGVLETDQELTPDAALALQATWEASHGRRHRKPAVASGGLKWRQISITPEESQFLETRKFSRAEIAGLFRVPPYMIGDVDASTSWGTGIEQQSIGFVTHTLGPWIARIEYWKTELLPRPWYVKKNVAGLLRGDLLSRYQAHMLGRSGGWLSVNDIRQIEDMPPVDGGDEYDQPLNWGPIGVGAMPGEQPAPNVNGSRRQVAHAQA